MKKPIIWIDFDNSPHVPFFNPIIQKLKNKGYGVILTARDCFQVIGLAEKFSLDFKIVGRHYGSSLALKVIGMLWRSFQLMPHVIKSRPVISVSHGSRSLVVASHILRIPTIWILDYEHIALIPFFKPVLGIAPELIKNRTLSKNFKYGLANYPGLKEDVYVSHFKPDPSFLAKLGVSSADILVTIRPPATEAHYHNPEAEPLFVEVVEYLSEVPQVKMVILPRNEAKQGEYIHDTWPQLCETRKIIIPDQVVNGLQMIWHSDLVVSGGGTMNREAAALNVPVYSIFRGTKGAVDKYLAQEGKLIFIEKISDVRAKIKPIKRTQGNPGPMDDLPALEAIVTIIEKTISKRSSVKSIVKIRHEVRKPKPIKGKLAAR